MGTWAEVGGSCQAVPCCTPGLAGGEGQPELGVQRPLPYLRGFLEAKFTDWEKEVEISLRPTKLKGLQIPGDAQ